jgi:hypothetical protein
MNNHLPTVRKALQHYAQTRMTRSYELARQRIITALDNRATRLQHQSIHRREVGQLSAYQAMMALMDRRRDPYYGDEVGG